MFHNQSPLDESRHQSTVLFTDTGKDDAKDSGIGSIGTISDEVESMNPGQETLGQAGKLSKVQRSSMYKKVTPVCATNINLRNLEGASSISFGIGVSPAKDDPRTKMDGLESTKDSWVPPRVYKRKKYRKRRSLRLFLLSQDQLRSYHAGNVSDRTKGMTKAETQAETPG